MEEHAPRPQKGALELSAVYSMQLVIYSMTCLEPCLYVLHMNSAGKQCVGGENEVHLLRMFALTRVRSTLHALNITYHSSSLLNKWWKLNLMETNYFLLQVVWCVQCTNRATQLIDMYLKMVLSYLGKKTDMMC